MPSPFVPDAAMGARWDEKLASFHEAVSSGDPDLQDMLFRELVDVAIRRYHLENSYGDLEESRAVLVFLKNQLSESESFYFSTNACHAGTRDAALYLRAPSEIMGLIDRQKEVIAAQDGIRNEALNLLENDLLDALAGLDEMPVEDGLPQEMTLSPAAASIFGDIFKSLADMERAQKYYNIAAINPLQTATGAVWYRIRALEIDVRSEDESKRKEAVKEIESLRAGLSDLLFAIYDERITEEARSSISEDTVSVNLEDNVPRVSAGTEDQVYEIDALAWGVLYDAYVKAGDDGKLHELEEDRRGMVRGRIGEAGELESLLQVDNMDRVALLKTVHKGSIEQALRSEDQRAAGRVQRQLIEDLRDVYALINPNMERRRGDPIFEGFARLNWRTFFGGYAARDLPQTALYYLADFMVKSSASDECVNMDDGPQLCEPPADAPQEYPEIYMNALDDDLDQAQDCRNCAAPYDEYYDRSGDRLSGAAPWFYDEYDRVVGFGDTNFIESELAHLRENAPQVFFADGTLNPDVDVEDTEAADRVMSAYWRSNDTLREVGLPASAAIGCFAIATIFAETLVVPTIAAVVCGGGASLANREINESNASDQYWQARNTGIAQITPREAKGNKGVWYFTEGMNTIFNAAMLGPATSVWGRAGLEALKKGIARGSGWLAGEAGVRALLRAAAGPLETVSRAALGIGRAAETAGQWYWKLPVGTRLRMAGLLPAGIDYGFVNRDGNLVSWDGKLDHWYGYAGLTAAASEAGYQLFSRTWQPAFAEAVAASSLRSGIARLGADMAASDYYLVKKNQNGEYEFVDFNGPRSTSLEEHAFESQFGIDTYLGAGGLLLASGDWMQNEIRMMSWLERTLATAGAGGVIYDIADDGHLNSAAGGIGGSIIASEVCYRALNVNALGSMAFLPFRILGEWTVQAMQDVPIQAPDPVRLISSTAESAFMLMVVKGLYQGNHYWNTFPLGRNLAAASSELPVLRYLRSIQNLGRYSMFGGNKASLDGWSGGIRTRPLRSMANGDVVYKLRGDKHWNGFAENNEDLILRVAAQPGGAAPKFFFNEMQVTENFLLEHGYFYRNGAIFEFQPLRNGHLYLGGRKMTAHEIRNLNDGARSRVVSELRENGWRMTGNHFERYWIERPYHPEVLLERPQGRLSTPEYKIVESSVRLNGDTVPVWLKFSRRTIMADEALVGGRKIVTWTGQREQPHFTPWGVAIQGPPVIGSAYATNYLLFHRVARGDPEYQPLSRLALYVPTVYFTWPVIQAPLGLDTAQARLTGTLFGQFFLMGSAWLYPPYRNTAPGQQTLYDLLDAGGTIDRPWYHPNSDNAFDSFGRIATSFSPGFWGSTQGSFFEIENPAMDNLRIGLDCRMDLANDIDFGDSRSCISLPDSTQDQIRMLEHDVDMEIMKKRLDAWAKLFESKMGEERGDDLSERERRLLIMLGAWFKHMLNDNERYEPVLENIRRVRASQQYAWFFDLIPTLTTDSEWEDFVKQVNGGRARASDFYFDPHMH